ncbi:hypothetical protein C2845_PM02G25920 [Panicum miliaceum]|uniref:Uncharacterized protein n=1 Tax=Panicum miliaceum TaxID=4540 RepID=A0A3L6S612_PANMI|nr:hypothetical protein C2845_PM02G25920 [Panicum miliaceum]
MGFTIPSWNRFTAVWSALTSGHPAAAQLCNCKRSGCSIPLSSLCGLQTVTAPIGGVAALASPQTCLCSPPLELAITGRRELSRVRSDGAAGAHDWGSFGVLFLSGW